MVYTSQKSLEHFFLLVYGIAFPQYRFMTWTVQHKLGSILHRCSTPPPILSILPKLKKTECWDLYFILTVSISETVRATDAALTSIVNHLYMGCWKLQIHSYLLTNPLSMKLLYNKVSCGGPLYPYFWGGKKNRKSGQAIQKCISLNAVHIL